MYTGKCHLLRLGTFLSDVQVPLVLGAVLVYCVTPTYVAGEGTSEQWGAQHSRGLQQASTPQLLLVGGFKRLNSAWCAFWCHSEYRHRLFLATKGDS